MSSPLLATVSRVLLPLSLLYALHLLLRGHHEPGGGFIAGLFTALVFGLLLVAFGREGVDRALAVPPRPVMAAGLALAAFTGLGSLAWGRPFLTSAAYHGHLPFFGEVELTTVLAFDVGVYLVVVGVVLTLLRAISRDGGEA